MMREFLIALPSNSNLLDYPDNETGNFRVNLSEDITLNGNWIVRIAFSQDLLQRTRR